MLGQAGAPAVSLGAPFTTLPREYGKGVDFIDFRFLEKEFSPSLICIAD